MFSKFCQFYNFLQIFKYYFSKKNKNFLFEKYPAAFWWFRREGRTSAAGPVVSGRPGLFALGTFPGGADDVQNGLVILAPLEGGFLEINFCVK